MSADKTMGNITKRTKRFNGRNVALLVIAAIIICALGVWGTVLAYHRAGSQGTILDAIYSSMQFFKLGSRLEAGPKPWQAELARFLAPLFTLAALLEVIAALLGRGLRLRFLRGHTIVCGLGRKGVFIAHELLRRGEQVVVIEQTADHSALAGCRRLGALIIEGFEQDPSVLKMARVDTAARLICVCGADADNLACARAAERLLSHTKTKKGPLQCIVHAASIGWAACASQVNLLPLWTGRIETVLFNFYEQVARRTLSHAPLDRIQITPEDKRRVHLVVIGFGQMGEALTLQAAHIAHLANCAKPAVTIIDPAVHNLRNAFLARRPAAGDAVDLDFIECIAQDPVARQRLVQLAGDGQQLLTVAVCVDRPQEAIEIALSLPAALSDTGIPVLVRLTEDSGIASVFSATQTSALTPFCAVADGCGMDFIGSDNLDEIPRAIHLAYLAHETKKNKRLGSEPSLLPWEQLNEDLRDSCRRQADHTAVKLRAVGCKIVKPAADKTAAEFNFTAEELEMVARMEHQRWCAERYLKGWRLEEKKDVQRRLSPWLVPWERLPEDMREYDRVFVRAIPGLLLSTGLGVERGV